MTIFFIFFEISLTLQKINDYGKKSYFFNLFLYVTSIRI